jgi:hypothetical protein
MKAYRGRWTKAPRILIFVIYYSEFAMFINFLFVLFLLLLDLRLRYCPLLDSSSRRLLG